MRNLRLVVSLLSGVALSACGGDEPEDSTDTTADTTADAGGEAGGGDAAADGSDPGDGSGDQEVTLRIQNVQISAPAGVGQVLQNLINTDIEENELHVLIQLFGFQLPFPTPGRVRGNAGQISGEGYTWYEGVEVTDAGGFIDADGNFSNCVDEGDPSTCETLNIIFPALEPGATEPLQIPVSNLGLTGMVYEGEAGWEMEGVLTGALLREEIADIGVALVPGTEPQPLSALLGESRMDYPVDDNATETGWVLRANIFATEVQFVPRAE